MQKYYTDYYSRISFMGNRLHVCEYRFYKLIQTRRKEIPRLVDPSHNEAIADYVRNNVLNASHIYANCLRGAHDSLDIPDDLQHSYFVAYNSVDEFDKHVYTNLAPIFILHYKRLDLCKDIHKHMTNI